MRSATVFFILFSLLLLMGLNDARKDPGEYWRSMMNDEPMPKAITDFFPKDLESQSNEYVNHFIKDFNIKPNVIIYHRHAQHKDVKIRGHRGGLWD